MYSKLLNAAVRKNNPIFKCSRNIHLHKERSNDYIVVSKRASMVNWPDTNLGPLNKINPNYPLPGYVGVEKAKRAILPRNLLRPYKPAVKSLPSCKEETYVSYLTQTFANIELSNPYEDRYILDNPIATEVERRIFNCPLLLRNEFEKIFQSRNIKNSNLSVIILSYRTEHDSSVESIEMLNERKDVSKKFVDNAISICSTLKNFGHWSDFINPYTGLPYIEEHSKMDYVDTFKTEDNIGMKHLGFQVDEIGCCKIVRHSKWNRNHFAGLIITDASIDHPVISKNLEPFTN